MCTECLNSPVVYTLNTLNVSNTYNICTSCNLSMIRKVDWPKYIRKFQLMFQCIKHFVTDCHSLLRFMQYDYLGIHQESMCMKGRRENRVSQKTSKLSDQVAHANPGSLWPKIIAWIFSRILGDHYLVSFYPIY